MGARSLLDYNPSCDSAFNSGIDATAAVRPTFHPAMPDQNPSNFWTFNGKVPGPFIRVRVGDTLEVHLTNDPNSIMIHSVDFHAAIGPGGGAEFTQADPGLEKIYDAEGVTIYRARG